MLIWFCKVVTGEILCGLIFGHRKSLVGFGEYHTFPWPLQCAEPELKVSSSKSPLLLVWINCV